MPETTAGKLSCFIGWWGGGGEGNIDDDDCGKVSVFVTSVRIEACACACG
jgi:hypothetical protein